MFGPASYHLNKLDGLTRFINQNVHKYDLIALTGDLATSGDAVDINFSGKFVEGNRTHPYNSNAEQLELQYCPLILMPGNHDHYGARAQPIKNTFALRFGKHLKNYNPYGVGYRVVTSNSSNSAYAMIYADFTFNNKNEAKNRFHRYGGGIVNNSTLQSLEKQTHALRKKISEKKLNPVVVWMIHFAPYDVDDVSLQLTDFERVIETAERCEIPTILCGHTHKARVVKSNNTTIFCAGAATSVDCKNILHEVELDDDGKIVANTNLFWDEGDGVFKA